MAAAENTSGDCPNEQSGMDEFKYINDKFPHEVLVMFFSYLPRDDIITVQRVCRSWRAAAQDRCLWYNYTLSLTGKPEDEKEIIIMPALRNINGHAENNMVNIILENTVWLNKMNCIFDPEISAAQVQSMIEEYPELESITLHLSAPDVLQSIEALKGCKHLKELLSEPALFLYQPNGEPSSSSALLLHICNLFADENNFPALRKLELPDIISAEHDHFKAIVADIIVKRSLMLQSLKLKIGTTDNADILNSVFMCTKLEDLHLQLNADQLVDFNLDQMSGLKSLFLSLYVKNNDCIPPVCESFNRGTWLHLEEIQLTLGTSVQFRGVLTAIIQNAKQLKSLTYIDEGYKTCEQELKLIGTLKKLERIEVTGLQALTKEGVMFLAGCHNLNYIYLMVQFSEDTFLEDLGDVMRLLNLSTAVVTRELRFIFQTKIDAGKLLMAENTSGDCLNQQSGKDEFEYINDKFPHEVIIMFFSNLPRDDIITVQRVCRSWRAAAQDRCLWDNYTLTLTGEPEDEKKIIIMPALRNINGYAENRMVNVILENTMRLNKMNCDFDPRISTAQVQSMLEKYPELESINLHLNAPDVLQSVEALKGSKHLKELLFYKLLNLYLPNGESICVLILRIFYLLADENNFPALRKLNLLDFCFVFECDDFKAVPYDQFRAVMADIILKRSLKLQSLRLETDITDNADILNSVCMCTKLEELHLQLEADQLVNFNLDQMSELKSLFLTLYVKNNNCIPPVCESLNRGTWLHLEEIYFRVKTRSQFRGGVLTAIIQNAKQLKSLTYDDAKYETCEQELKHIDTLIKLQKIDITGLQAITKEGYTLLAGCQNLNYICLAVHFSEDTLYMDIAVLMRSMKKLGYFSFDDEMDSMYFSSREKIENFISKTLST